ncbi:hypothetical protein [Chitinophaga filiformis]|uniref:Uncharacterized protein n=1 Tax=Chitinophaga filiformis TaxID=104663 RepID=A0A1G7MDQ1_CHIFI|nr:hypothetical protein [Chitinophaga filiformis]SDF59937.1 hypothetical protein SAMN04488121_102387 [Chitinophaga filiformis]
MIQKFHFQNGTTAFFTNRFTEDGEPILKYNGRRYALQEHPTEEEGFIKVGGQMFWADGSYDLIEGREVKLYWRNVNDHEISAAAAKLVLTDYPDTPLLSFGSYNSILFTQDSESFKVVIPNSSKEFRGTLDEVRLFIENNY